MGKKKEQVENISITEYEKALEPVIYTRKKFIVMGLFFLTVIGVMLLVKKIGPSFLAFFGFIFIITMPIFFIFDSNITKWIFPIYEDTTNIIQDSDLYDKFNNPRKYLTPKNIDYLIIFLIILFSIAGIMMVLQAKGESQITKVLLGALFFSTAGVLSMYGLDDDFESESIVGGQVDDDSGHVHKVGAFVTSTPKKRKKFAKHLIENTNN